MAFGDFARGLCGVLRNAVRNGGAALAAARPGTAAATLALSLVMLCGLGRSDMRCIQRMDAAIRDHVAQESPSVDCSRFVTSDGLLEA